MLRPRGVTVAIAVAAVAVSLPAGTAVAQDVPRSALDAPTAPGLLGQFGRIAIGGEPAAALGDVDGDGRADVGVAAGPAYRSATPDGTVDRRGAVQVSFERLDRRIAFGAARGLLIRPTVPDAEPAVAPAGDLDEDGLADVAVAVGGQAWIVWGRREPGIVVLGADAGSTRVQVGDTGYVGAVATAGDLDGDGRPDLAVGVVATAAGNRSPGAVGIVHGTGARLADPVPQTVIGGLSPGSNLGSAVVALGDTDGDGIDDLGMASRPYELIRPVPGATPATAWVVRGARTREPVDLRGGGPRVTELAPGAVALRSAPVPYRVGDLDGDGRAEIGVDDYQFSTTTPRQPQGFIPSDGRVLLVRGTAAPPARIDLSELGDAGVTLLDVPDGGDRLGGGGITAADLDGDGRREVVLGAVVNERTGGAIFGNGVAALLVLRHDIPAGAYRSDDPLAVAHAVVARATFGGYVPVSVANAGDQDGDGRDDLLVGHRNFDGVSCRGGGGAVTLLTGGIPAAADPGPPEYATGPVVRVGTAASDRLQGGRFADRLSGLGADDCIDGQSGDDVLEGGDGDDELSSWQGGARLDGGAGADVLRDIGEELYERTPGLDVLIGGAGSDTIEHTAGPVRIDAGDGNDTVSDGGSGIVVLGAGDDFYSGTMSTSIGKGSHGGAHRVDAGPGDDRAFGARQSDVLRGGPGDDELSGGSRNDRLTGDAGRDRLDGGPGDDRLDGGTGDDRVDGLAGRDRLTGGAGADRLDGGPGVDELTGGTGVDRIHAADGERDVIRCDGDRDRLVVDRLDRLVRCARARVTRRPLPPRRTR